MNYEAYMKERSALLAQAKAFAGEGKKAEFEARKKEIEALDRRYEEESRLENSLSSLENGAVARTVNVDRNGIVPVAVLGNEADLDEDIFASLEYRKAFMAHAVSGTPIPDKFKNADQNTLTTDVGSVIPTPVLERIIEKLEATGMILPLVTRTSIKGGLSIPTSSVKPVAEWVDEGKGSDRQKKTTGKISFNYHKLRCAVSVSLEVDTMALDIFETTLINNVVEAMIMAIEQAIISGDGVGKPKGITQENPGTKQIITASEDITDLEEMEANLPIEYEANAVFCMTKKTFMYYSTLKDANGQPIGRINYGGAANRPERVLLGRTVVLCNYLPSIDIAAQGKPIAILFNFKDYILNTNLQMGIKRYEDNETDDQVTKAVTLVDGKVVDKGSLVLLKKG